MSLGQQEAIVEHKCILQGLYQWQSTHEVMMYIQGVSISRCDGFDHNCNPVVKTFNPVIVTIIALHVEDAFITLMEQLEVNAQTWIESILSASR